MPRVHHDLTPATRESGRLAALRPGSRVLRRPRPPVEPEVMRARVGLLGLYGLLGLTVAGWLSRLPTVRTSLGLTTGELGSVLLTGALASLVTVLVSGGLVGRWGSRRSMVVAAWLFSAAAVLLGLGPALGSVPVLVAGVVAMSASFALGNVPLNVEAVRIEKAMGRTVVPQFHAAFSVGSVLGSGLGALAAWGHVPLVVQFSVISAVSLIWRLRTVASAVLPASQTPTFGASGGQGAAARRGSSLREALRAWRDPRTLILGVVVAAGALSEGTANTWLAIGMIDGFAAREAVGALVFAAFVAAMTVARLGGTVLIDRFGRTAVLLGSMSLAVAGLVGYGLAPTLSGAVIGAVAWGLGAGLVVPIAMSATTGDGLGAAGRVAVVSAFASTANIAAPPVIGVIAEQIGVRHAVLGVAAFMVAGALLARRVTATAGLHQDVRVPAATTSPEPTHRSACEVGDPAASAA